MTYQPTPVTAALPPAAPLSGTDTIQVSQDGVTTSKVTLSVLASTIQGNTLGGAVTQPPPAQPTSPTGTVMESASDTVVTAAGTFIIDAALVAYSLLNSGVVKTGMQVAIAGAVDVSTARAASLLYHVHAVYYSDTSGYWYKRTGTSWVHQAAGDPRGASTSGGTVTPPAAETLTVVTPAAQAVGGAFTVRGTYANATPTALDYSLDGGATWVAAVSPSIAAGAFSFALTVSVASASQAVLVRDHNATTISAASGTFVVSADPAPIFFDDFSGSAIDTTKWAYEYKYSSAAQGSVDGSAFRVDPTYAPTASLNPFSLAGGVLTISTRPTPSAMLPVVNNLPFTSGLLNTGGKKTFTYGYFEINAKTSNGSGCTCQFWLTGDTTWPPEIDAMEVIGNQPGTINLDAFWGDPSAPSSNSLHYYGADLSTAFHKYAVDWQADYITWFFDDQQTAQIPTAAGMNVPMNLIVSMSVGTSTSFQGYPAAGTTFPQTYQIESVTVMKNRPSRLANKPAPAKSAKGTTITTVGPAIYDGAGNVYALNSAKQSTTNGTPDQYSANDVELYWDGATVFKKNSNGKWYSKSSAAALYAGPVASPLPATGGGGQGASATSTVSPANASITSASGQLVDANGDVWTLTPSTVTNGGLGCAKNGAVIQYTANVNLGIISSGAFWQRNTAGEWYAYIGGAFVDEGTADPRAAGGGTAPSGTMVTPTTAAGSLTVKLAQQTGQRVYGSLYGFGTGSMADQGFFRCNDPMIYSLFKQLKPRVFRINNNANINGQGWQDKVFANGVGNPDWQWFDNLFDYFGNWAPSNCEILLGLGGGDDNEDATSLANKAVALARRAIAKGRPIKLYEVGNEQNGRLADSIYYTHFNTVADALHGVDASYQVFGPVHSFVPGYPAGGVTDFGNNCGSRASGALYHTYGFRGWQSAANPRDALYASTDMVDQLVTARRSLAGTPGANLPLVAGEWNIVGDGSNPPEQQNIAGGIYNATQLLKVLDANIDVRWGANWDIFGDGTYGVIFDPTGNYSGGAYSIAASGYVLGYAGQCMDGQRVSTTLNISGRIAAFAVVSGSKFAIQATNYDTGTAFNGFQFAVQALSGVSDSVTVWQISPANLVPVTRTASYASLTAAGLNLPAESVTHITGTFT